MTTLSAPGSARPSADVASGRFSAVTAFVQEARKIVSGHEVTHVTLERIGERLTRLGAQAELFPLEHFPVPTGTGAIYRLAEDPDGRFALFASAGLPGKAVPPHDHTVWAVIAAVHGREHNVIYRRLPDGPAGEGRLEVVREQTASPGAPAVRLLPEDVHTIEIQGDEPALHLHFYGLSLDRLDERVKFSGPDGGSYARFAAPPTFRAPAIGPHELKAAIRDGRELALLDVRDEGVFARRHLLFAAPAPLSRLELVIDRLVPRRTARIVLTDEGEELVHQAADKLARWGYRDISVLRGGIEAWREAGYEIFSGVHVPSKAFGEVVEHELGTPRLEPAEIQALRDEGADLVILDSRPIEEFQAMSIPGGLDCPGAELVHRVNEVVRSADTLVVVNCAGRTRSIIGAQSLINAGIENRVVALKNGTMGWHLAGLPLAHGETRAAPPPSAAALARSRAQAAAFAAKAGVEVVSHEDLARLQAEAEHRSLFVLDVRSPEEYAAGHLPGSRSAPGGQLVQSTDLYVGTLNARIVLVDGEGVRAPMTASWLIQLGWMDVSVLDGLGSGPLEIGPEPVRVQPVASATPRWIDPAALHDIVEAGHAFVIDVENSLDFRKRHIPGASFATRLRLGELLAHAPAGATIVLTSRDGVLARLVASDLASTERDVRVLLGGTAAWRSAELPLESGRENRIVGLGEDVWYKPYDWTTDQEAHMREYLTWEVDLVAQVERDGDARFRLVRPDGPARRPAADPERLSTPGRVSYG